MAADLKNRTILLVEDEALIALSEAEMLRDYGFSVINAYSGREAVESAINSEVDLILMDIDLGEGRMDGTEAAVEILKQKALPIVFLTSHDEKEMVERVKGITRYGYVLKNSGEFVLIEAIIMAFELFDAHSELKLENSARKSTEENFKETAALYTHLMENSIDAVYLLSEKGKVLNANKMACGMLGYDREELLNLSIDDIDPNYPSKKFISFWQDKPVSSTLLFETIHRHKDGKTIPVEVNGIFFYLKGKKYLFGVARDIGERKENEQVLAKSSEQYRRLVENLHEGVGVVDIDENIIFANPAFAEIFGYSREELLERNLREFMPEEEYKRIREETETRKKGLVNTYDTVIINKAGDKRRIRVNAAPWVTEGISVTSTMGLIRDITDEYSVVESLKKSQDRIQYILSSIPEDLYIVDMDTYEILFMNDHMKASFPKAKEGDRCYAVYRDIDTPCPHCNNSRLLDENGLPGAVITWECYNPVNKRWYLNYDRAVPWVGEKYVRMQIAADITTQKQAQNQKDFLLKEINHRVKNNLLMVSSLISLKDTSLGAKADLSDLRQQMDSVRIVYEKLYQNDEGTFINLREYVQELLETVFSFNEQPVIINNGVQVDHIHTKTAIPLGLIINETATNAVKHGFSGDMKEFSVNMKSEAGSSHYLLDISNNGSPFPPEIDIDTGASFGLKLISSLVKQLGGSVELTKTPFPRYSIRFPKERE